MDKYIAIIVLGNLISSIAIIYANKTEISWLKKLQDQHHDRITSVELKMNRRHNDCGHFVVTDE